MKKMLNFFSKRSAWVFTGFLILLIAVVYLVASLNPIPYRLITNYPISMLVEEGQFMHDCAECHESEDFHKCDTCHNEHGSADLAGLKFYSVVHVIGDVPEETYFPINQLFSKRNEETNQIRISDFLADLGVSDLASITFCTNDGGFSTITKKNLGETSYLLPYEEGMRFADKALHVSTWLKGINKIIIVSNQKNLSINGSGYSFGELLLNDTVQFTVEQAPVMLSNAKLGTLKTGTTATRLEGVELAGIVNIYDSSSLNVECTDGSTQSVPGIEASDAKLVLIGDQITLVFPQKSRNQWIFGVKSIEVE